jgi:hypothetical protein
MPVYRGLRAQEGKERGGSQRFGKEGGGSTYLSRCGVQDKGEGMDTEAARPVPSGWRAHTGRIGGKRDRDIKTNRGSGVAPKAKGARGKADGEVSGPQVLDRLGSETMTLRPPGFRHNVVLHSTADISRQEHDKA